MSKSIDERIVAMQFQNKQFEEGIGQSMKSLEKFDEALKFDGASKGIDKVGKTLNQMNLSPLQQGAAAVTKEFDALNVAITTVVFNLTNSLTNAAKNMVKSLSIDQLTAGFDKYTDKTAAVQTIMNATGKSVDEVSVALEKLQWFSDETSYSFVDMTSNVGKFTSAGIELNTAISAMQGIANAAADAGANSVEASRAMYNFSQALSRGYVQLIDWKSIENANMSTIQFKQTMVDAGKELGTLVEKNGELVTASKGNVVNAKNFNEALSDGWLTTEVLLKALGKYSEYSDKIYQVSDAFDTCADAMAATSEEGMELGARAFKAAQQAKTFRDAVDATKDAVSSGWMRTFEIIFGDFNESVELWTEFCGALWDIFASGAESRNELLTDALSDGWHQLMGDFSEAYKILVNDEAVQSLQDLRKSYVEAVAAGEEFTDEQFNGQDMVAKLTAAVDNQIDSISKMSQEEIIQNGITKESYEDLKNLGYELHNNADYTDELAKSLASLSGRENIIQAIRNAYEALLNIVEPIKEGFAEIFPEVTAEKIYNMTEAVKNFTQRLVDVTENFGGLKVVGATLAYPFRLLADSFEYIEPFAVAIGEQFVVISDAFQEASRTGNPFINMLRNFLGDERYEKLAESLAIIIERIGQAFIMIKDAVVDAFNAIANNKYVIAAMKAILAIGLSIVINVIDAIINGLYYITHNTFTQFLYDLGAILGTLYKAFKKVGDYLLDGLANAFKKVLGDDKYTKFVKDLKTLVGKLKTAFSRLGSAITDAGKSFFTFENFKNILTTIVDILRTVGETAIKAFAEIIGFIAGLDFSSFDRFVNSVFANFCNMLHSLGDYLKTGAINIISHLIGEVNAENLINGIANAFGGLLDIFHAIADVIRFIIDLITGGKSLAETIGTAIGNVLKFIHDALKKVWDILVNIKTLLIDNPLEFIKGVINGIGSALTNVGNVLSTIGGAISNFFKSVKENGFLETVFGIQEGVDGATDSMTPFQKVIKGIADGLKSLGDAIVDFLSKLTPGKILVYGFVGAMLSLMFGLVNMTNQLFTVIKTIQDMFKNIGTMADSVTGFFKAVSKAANPQKYIDLGVAVGIIAVSILMLSELDFPTLIVSFIGFSAVMVSLAVSMNLLAAAAATSPTVVRDITKLTFSIIAMAAAIDLVALAVRMLEDSDPLSALAGLATVVAALAALMGVLRLVGGSTTIENAKNFAIAMASLSLGTVLMSLAIKQLEAISMSDALSKIIQLVGIVSSLAIASKAMKEVKASSAVGMTIMVANIALMMLVINGIDKRDVNRAISSVAALMIVATEVTALALALRVAGGNAGKGVTAMLKLTIAIRLMLSMVNLMNSFSMDALKTAAGITIAIGVVLSGIAALGNRIAGSGTAKLAGLVLSLAGSIMMLSLIVEYLGSLDNSVLVKGAIAVESMIAIFTLPLAFAHVADKAGDVIIKMTIAASALLALGSILGSFSKFSNMAAGIVTVETMLLSIGGTMALLGKAENAKVGKTIGLFSAVLAELSLVLIPMAALDLKAPLDFAISLGILMLAFGKAMSTISENATDTKIAKSQIAAMAAIAGEVVLLFNIDFVGSDYLRRAVALGGLMGALTFCMIKLNEAMENAPNQALNERTLINNIVALGSIAAAAMIAMNSVILVSDDYIPRAFGLGLLIAALTTALIAINKYSDYDSSAKVNWPLLGSHITMLGTIGAAAVGALYALPKDGGWSLIPKIIALDAVMAGLTGVFYVVSQFANVTVEEGEKVNAGLVLSQIALIGSIAAAAVLALNNVQTDEFVPMMTKALGLDLVLAGLAGVAYVIAKLYNTLEETEEPMKKVPGLLATFAGVVVVVATAVLALNFMPDDTNGIFVKVGALVLACLGITVVAAAIALLGKLGEVLGPGMANGILNIGAALLVALLAIVLIVALITGIALALSQINEDTMATIQLGFDNMGLILAGIGSAIGSFFGGIQEGATSTLPEIGTHLSDFATNIQGFIDMINSIDTHAVDAFSGMMKAINDVMTSGMINTIIEKLTGDGEKSVVDQFGEAINALADDFVEFSTKVGGLGDDVVQKASYAAQVLQILNEMVPKENGLIQWFTGTRDYEKFSAGLEALGNGVGALATSVNGITFDQTTLDKVDYFSQAMEKINTVVPTEDGLINMIFGKFAYQDFASNLDDIGAGIAGFANNLQGVTFSDTEKTMVSNVSDALAKINELIPTAGGFIQMAFGTTDYVSFTAALPAIGAAIAGFVTDVSPINSVTFDKAKVTDVADALKKINDTIPTTGGMVGDIFGGKDLPSFATGMANLGDGIKSFGTSITDMSWDSDMVQKAIDVASAVSQFAENDIDKTGGWDIFNIFGETDYSMEDVKTGLENLGAGINSFGTSINDTPSIEGLSTKTSIALAALTSAVSWGKDNTSAITNEKSGLTAMGKAIQEYGVGLGALINSLNTLTYGDKSLNQTSALNNGINIATAFFTGLSIKNEELKTLGKTVVENFLGGLILDETQKRKIYDFSDKVVNNLQNDFGLGDNGSKRTWTIGKKVVDAFLSGMSDTVEASTDDISAVAISIGDKFKASLGISGQYGVSTLFKNIGLYCVQGFCSAFNMDDTATKTSVGKTLASFKTKFTSNLQKEFAIKSPSKVMRDEVGRYLVDGIAEGITENDSAVEAAQKMAQNITSAFQEEIDKYDFNMSFQSSELNLWKAQNPNASDSELSMKELEYQQKELAERANQLVIYEAQYRANVAEFGTEAQATKEAEKKWMDAQTDAMVLANDIATANKDLVSSNEDAFRSYMQEYNKWHHYLVEEQGFSEEEVRNYLMKMTGYNPEISQLSNHFTTMGEVYSQFLKEAMVAQGIVGDKVEIGVMTSVQEALDAIMQQALEEAQETEEEAAEETADIATTQFEEDTNAAINEALANASAPTAANYAATSAIPEDWWTNTLASAETQIETGTPTIEELASEDGPFGTFIGNLKGGLTKILEIFGLDDTATSAILDKGIATISDWGSKIAGLFSSGEDGESQGALFGKMTGIGGSIVTAITSGLSGNSEGVVSALKDIATNLGLGGDTGAADEAEGSGESIGQGIVDGILSSLTSLINQQSIQNAISALTQGMVSTAQTDLDEHSPSKVFMRIGSFAVLGLAQGIKSGGNNLNRTVTDICANAIETTANAVDQALSEDYSPIITPVVDDSWKDDLEEDSYDTYIKIDPRNRISPISYGRIGSSMPTTAIPSYQQRPVLSAMLDDLTVKSEVVKTKSDDSGTTQTPTYNFVQHNNFVKEASAAQIYRNSRNLLSQYRNRTYEVEPNQKRI